ncbi:hypothetical protein [Streptomyces sp. cmx-18-6]|uniref:hypothetical protein n=1 Tax=Streptomyces sp. cmx-18-6 TaxID=2790930 RepID=UPI0039804AB3
MRGGGAYRLRRMLRRQRRGMAAGLALAGAALATTGLGSVGLGSAGLGSAEGDSGVADTVPGPGRTSVQLVSAPVRIADAETVRLLRPGDRVDVIAVGEAGDDARLVARGVRVAEVPRPAADDGGFGAGGAGSGYAGSAGSGTIGTAGASAGALVTLSVERSTATALLGAGAAGRLAVAVSDAH